MPVDVREDVAARAETSLENDLGIVRPGETRVCRFKVRNPTKARWTFRTFHRECSCTVTQSSAASIAPGAEEEVEVSYKAPMEVTDQRRRVGVEFSEGEAPYLWLTVTARVRDPITTVPERVSFRRVARGHAASSVLDVHNYTGGDIELGEVKTSVDWLKASLTPPIAGSAPNGPRQTWRVLIQADSTLLGSGRHRAEVALASKGGLDPKVVAVELEVASPVEAIPGQIFFGSVDPGLPSRQKMTLQFATDSPAPDAGAVGLSHDLGDRLRLEYARRSDGFCEITATLTPAADDRLIRGMVDINFLAKDLPSLKVPIIALVAARGSSKEAVR